LSGQLGLSAFVCALSILSTQPAQAFHPELRDALKAKPVVSAKAVTAKDETCLANAIYFEARGESEIGQEAVAQVILNRAASGHFPRSLCGVVYQNQHRRNACQFSFACDGKPDTKGEKSAWKRAKAIARAMVTGEKQVARLQTATHYHAKYVKPRWAGKMQKLSTIGAHIFYRE
jgi:spore germination cell wall hydrolase CwlJ-like protein